MGAFKILAVLLAFSGCLHAAVGVQVQRDGDWVSVPFLEYAIQELKSHIPHGVDILDQHLGSIIPKDKLDVFKGFLELLDDGGATCSVCQAGVLSLAEMTKEYEWDEMRDPVVNACISLLLALDENTDVDEICPGTIDLQGPHVYHVLASLNLGVNDSKPNIKSCCENLNVCYPPKDEDTSQKTLSVKKPAPVKDPAEHHKQSGKQAKYRWANLQKLLLPHQVQKHKRKQRSTKKNTLRIAQLTDIHMDPLYAEGAATDCNLAVCCREKYEGEGSAHAYGDYNCNTPQTTINLFLEQVAEMDPEFIIYSGDTPPHSIWEETFESQLGCTEKLLESFNKTLSKYDIYTNIGNHEMYPTNLYYVPLQETVDMSAKFAELWQPFCKFEEEQMDTMKHAGYYSMLVRPGLRVISFNTLYWYNANFYTTLNEVEQDGEDMYDYLRQELEKARENNEKVILVGHHPPGGGSVIVSHSRRFVDAAVEYGDVIVLHMAGHTHKDDYRVVADADGVAKEIVFVAPSLTPRGRVNPSARVYELDPDTYELLNYQQYYMDIEAIIGGADVEIQLTYDAKELYGLADMSPPSWQDLAHRFEEDDDLFQEFYQNYNTQTGRGHCEGSCKTNRICALLNPNYDENQECSSPSLPEITLSPPQVTGPGGPGDEEYR